ncbi:MAG: MaoC family dehydratase N-terminal domain-containing protein [Acidimicrobiia bacterium]|nr:MaoC family dehydratase N-terminal domain-containing protein [Acidimicrobiia bacterium]
MADKSAVGATDTPFDMVVELGKIREFARATKSSNAAYLEADEPVSPPTFLTTAQFWSPPGESVMAKVGMDLRRVLHGGQEYVFHGPPPKAGTRLHAQSRVEDIYEKEGKRGGTMTFVIAVQEFRDDDGNLVAESRTTVIETGKAPEAQ